jgi:hypothetical protein
MGDESQQDAIKQAMIDDPGWSENEGEDVDAEDEDSLPEEQSQRAYIENAEPIKKKDPNDFSVPKRVPQGQEGKQAARKEPMNIPKSRQNKFKDSMSLESKDLKKNNPKLAAMYGDSSHRVVRDESESTGSQIHVECSLCGKEETVASSLAIGYHHIKDENTYRCNSCNTPSGRRKAERRIRELELEGKR